ncbi:MAG: FAD-binding protein [Chloroflexi bacterium]|nr:FAD-binding protein [Chloroflexota bacterium]
MIDIAKSLQSFLEPDQIITDLAEKIPYEIDSALERGSPDAVVFPHTTEEVSRLARWAFENKMPLVGRGAGTGRSGGAVPERGGIVVEFSQMDRLLVLDAASRVVVVQPGMVNLNLDNIVKAKDLYYPPDPSSGRVATIGGNVAENAGGPHCFKYGVTTKYITGLEIVLADGRVVNLGGSALDIPEYDFTGVVTGSEGTLALITKIQARLLRQPPGMQTMMAAFDSIRAAGDAVSAVIAAGLVPATLEMMDQKIMQFIEQYVHAGLPVHAGAMLIVEVDGVAASLSPQIQEIARILEKHGGFDLKIANSVEERNAIWHGRKSAGGAYPHYTVDSTVPRSRIADTLEAANEICERHGVKVGHVFHAGDGNLHPSIMVDPANEDQVARVMKAGEEILEQIVLCDGAISGEHGIGIEKREAMPLMFNEAELTALWDIKQVFDPTNLMNPGKIFPSNVPAKSCQVFSAPWEPHNLTSLEAGDVFTPTTAEHTAQGLVALSAHKRKVVINRKSEDGVMLDTKKLAGIKKYAPDDLYVTVGAGTRLEELQTFLANEGRQVALVSPWRESTVGGLIAANVNSPQRLLYGCIRDQLLAATVVLSDGRILRAGRPVVKNVAGYDLPKLLVGSFGTLGLMTDVTLKLYPRARCKRTLLAPIEKIDAGLAIGTRLLSRALVASALVLYKGDALPGIAPSGYVLAYTAEGVVEEVDAELAEARTILRDAGQSAIVESNDLSGTDLWLKLLGKLEAHTMQMRLGIAPKQLSSFVVEQSATLDAGSFLLDVPSGLVYATAKLSNASVAKTWVAELRHAALARSGYGIVMTMPDAWANEIEWYGYRPSASDLMQGLKIRWDPQRILGISTFPLS